MKKEIFYLLTLLFIIAPTSLMGISPIDLMPKDNEVEGWIADSNQCPWEGVAENVDELYKVIDGPAEEYIPYTFLKGAFKGYIDTLHITDDDTVHACLEIFDQTTHESALDVFKAVGIEAYEYEIVKDLGDTARIDTNFLVSICLELVSKNYFLRLSVYDKTPPFKQALLSIASVIVQNATPNINAHFNVSNKQVSLSILPAKHGVILKVTGNPLLINNPALSKILLYNIKGSLIDRLILKQGKNGNEAIAIWNGKNHQGTKVSSGSYIAILCLKNIRFVKKFILP